MKKIALGVAAVIVGCSACSTQGAESDDSNTDEPANVSASDDIPRRVTVHSSKVGDYGRPTVEDFVSSSFVTRVVEGDVTKVDTVVLEDDDVYTVVTISSPPTDGEGSAEQVVTRESGGTVTLEQVREAYEAHVSDDELNKNADQKIVYEYEDAQPHSKLGQHVFVMLAGSPDDPGGYYTAAVMVQEQDGDYVWPESVMPNPQWEKSLTEVDVARISDSESKLSPGSD